ncbi:hypothetical protein CHN50_13645 [Priestia aryabhattai]|uniref:SpoIID/LytB domain-containing protein n=1 Tax=Priestia TaxID=2800373 RepID=UPI000BA12F26|nr:SpoIID/LytB domain-containing protein [Priestia flexa]MDT2046083.1 SpoIID/LytB domain-containing protein [Priestia flexa]OZT11940.1 hypothetical protein CHN50_13645 [Priestia aryabhattai]
MKKVLAALVVMFMLSSSYSMVNVKAETNPTISVQLKNYLKNKKEIQIQTSEDAATSYEGVRLEANQTYRLKVEQGKISLYKGTTKLKEDTTFKLYTNQTAETLIEGRVYSGSFDFVIESNEYVQPINHVSMEEYLKGVVPNEMIPSWPVESLTAQAIAARTYAMGHLNKTINDTIQYQVYGGKTVYANTNAAVEKSYGQTLTYNGKLISALYSSSNGGVTESNANAWSGSPLPYLPIQTDSYDPKHPWNLTVKKQQIDTENLDLVHYKNWWSTIKENDKEITDNIKTYLQQKDYKGKEIKVLSIPKLEFTEKNASNRYNKGSLEVKFIVKDDVDSEGKLNVKTLSLNNVKASDIRPIIGVNLIKSYYVTEQNATDKEIVLKGLGYGHGVGMSQYGAYYRAKAGQTYDQILRFYYPNAERTQQYKREAKRLAGPERYDTAAEIAREGWTTARTVVIAAGGNFPDALAGAPLAVQENAPLLLTTGHELHPTVKAELQRLQPEKVIVLGSSRVIRDSVLDEIKQLGAKEVQRLGGADRFETSAAIAKQINSSKVIVVNGQNFPDALSVAPYAAKEGIPIVLTRPTSIPAATAQVLEGKAEAIVIGSEQVVNATVYNSLPANRVRYAGEHRYATNQKVVTNLLGNTKQAYVAAGTNFPDALAGSILAGKRGVPVILTDADKLPAGTADILSGYKDFTVLGSTRVVNDSVVNELEEIANK